MRCARCGHTWLADLPSKITAVQTNTNKVSEKTQAFPEVKKQTISEPPPAVKPIPPGSSLPTPWRDPKWKKWRIAAMAGTGVIVLALIIWMVWKGASDESSWLRSGGLSEVIGLTVNHATDGLSLQQVRSERRYIDGGMQLVVEGEVFNRSQVLSPVPDILVTAVGSDGKAIQDWKIDAPTATLAPGDKAPFQSTVAMPPGNVAEISLSFVEQKK